MWRWSENRTIKRRIKREKEPNVCLSILVHVNLGSKYTHMINEFVFRWRTQWPDGFTDCVSFWLLFLSFFTAVAGLLSNQPEPTACKHATTPFQFYRLFSTSKFKLFFWMSAQNDGHVSNYEHFWHILNAHHMIMIMDNDRYTEWYQIWIKHYCVCVRCYHTTSTFKMNCLWFGNYRSIDWNQYGNEFKFFKTFFFHFHRSGREGKGNEMWRTYSNKIHTATG